MHAFHFIILSFLSLCWWSLNWCNWCWLTKSGTSLNSENLKQKKYHSFFPLGHLEELDQMINYSRFLLNSDVFCEQRTLQHYKSILVYTFLRCSFRGDVFFYTRILPVLCQFLWQMHFCKLQRSMEVWYVRFFLNLFTLKMKISRCSVLFLKHL